VRRDGRHPQVAYSHTHLTYVCRFGACTHRLQARIVPKLWRRKSRLVAQKQPLYKSGPLVLAAARALPQWLKATSMSASSTHVNLTALRATQTPVAVAEALEDEPAPDAPPAPGAVGVQSLDNASALDMLATTATVIGYIADELESGGLKPKPVSAASGALGKRPRDIRASLPPLVAPLSAITGVSLETAELLAATFETASKLVAASESAIADIKLKSGRRIGNMAAKRVKLCFC
jgi:hypothetical protein